MAFITNYSQNSHREDFAEMLSTYLTNSQEQWDEWMKTAEGTVDDPANGRGLLEQKLDIVRNYMEETWNIDIDELRESILRREHDIVDGKIDLTDLTVN